jgi:hypothetical protein
MRKLLNIFGALALFGLFAGPAGASCSGVFLSGAVCANLGGSSAIPSPFVLGTGVPAWLIAPTSANLATAMTDETGSGSLVFANSPILVTPNLGTPSVVNLANGTNLPNSATTATSANTPSTIVARDGSGNFSAGTISAALNGNASADLPMVVTNAALTALASTYAPQVMRMGYVAQGDAPPQVYTSSASACSLNSGAGDGGSQIPTSDSKCWLAVWPATGADIREFGAIDRTGATDYSTAYQNAINALAGTGNALSLPAGKWKINTPLNVTNLVGLSINGTVGQFQGDSLVSACQSVGSVILGNTNNREVFDTIGSVSIHFNNLGICSIGQSTPSKYGIIAGSSTGVQAGSPGGTDISGSNVTISLAQGINSVPFTHNNGNGGDTWVNLSVSGDYGFAFTSTNPLSVTPTYGSYYGTSLGGTDGIRCYGCTSLSQGSGYALYIEGSNDIEFDQFYAVNNTSTPASYTGIQYPVYLNNTADIDIKIESDYWPSVVLVNGTGDEIRMKGMSYPYTTALGSNIPNIALFYGTSITNSSFNIEPIGSTPGGSHYEFSSAVTISSFYNDTFLYNTSFNSNTGYFNSAAATIFYGIKLVGNSNAPGISWYVNSVTATAPSLSYTVNDAPYGTANLPASNSFKAINFANLADSATAPTISSGCGGGSPSISAPNGTDAFVVTIGTASGSNCVLAMPTATTGWVCFANDLSTHTAANSAVVQTASSASSVTVADISDITGAATWVNGDKIAFLCRAY